jgi:hypothetical protein
MMPSEVNGSSDANTRLSPFDPSRLRLAQTTVQVREHLTSIPVRKPAREWFVQCHLSDEFRLLTTVLELKEDRETYLVDPDILDIIILEPCVISKYLVTSITRQGNIFLWPVRLPDASGRIDTWNRSALDAIGLASGSWVRVYADINAGAYKAITAEMVNIAPPVWPQIAFEEILRIAFKDHFIRDINHPILRKLRGEY